MAVHPGTRRPPNHIPKKGSGTKLPLAGGNKQIKEQNLSMGEASDIGPAPAHRRLYSRDYAKKGPSPSEKDYVTGALGDPLKI